MEGYCKKLEIIIEEYPNVIDNDKKLKAILKDYYPEDKRIQNHLYMVADDGILEDMKGVTEIKKFKMLGYIHSLVNDYGISETMEKDAILIWTKALKIKTEDIKVEDASDAKVKKEGNIINYSDSNNDDVEATGTVIKFQGKGPKVLNGIKLESSTYLIKTTGRPIIVFYDYKREKDWMCITTYSPSEEIWQKDSYISIDKEGIIEVSNADEEWTVEMIPI